jgi:hypothetical protein
MRRDTTVIADMAAGEEFGIRLIELCSTSCADQKIVVRCHLGYCVICVRKEEFEFSMLRLLDSKSSSWDFIYSPMKPRR